MASAFFTFIIVLVGLLIIVGMIFLALDKIAKDEFLKKIGKIAVGGAAVLVLLIQLKATFFGGGGGGGIAPSALIEFTIGVIILIVLFLLIEMAVNYFIPQWAAIANMVLTALMLVLLLVIAEQALFGGGLGMISKGTFQFK